MTASIKRETAADLLLGLGVGILLYVYRKEIGKLFPSLPKPQGMWSIKWTRRDDELVREMLSSMTPK